jgi:hypothetical protein
MNYAWSNPTTGMREQTRQPKSNDPADLERIKQEARALVWQELQAAAPEHLHVNVHEQIPAGSVSTDGDSVDPRAVLAAGWPETSYSFAYTDPTTGQRCIWRSWPGFLTGMLGNDLAQSVIVYASRFAFAVTRDEIQPEAPLFPEPSEAPAESSPLEDLRREVLDFTRLENEDPAPRATALALIDIAQSLRVLLGRGTDNAEPKVEFTRLFPNADDVYTVPELEEVCTCAGDGLKPDGTPCVCAEGQAKKRAAEVASRKRLPNQRWFTPEEESEIIAKGLANHNRTAETAEERQARLKPLGYTGI